MIFREEQPRDFRAVIVIRGGSSVAPMTVC
jgi:hypothetical protein